MVNTELQNTSIREILSIQNPLVLTKLESYLKQILNEENVILIDYERRIVETGISQIYEGDFFTDDEVVEKTKQWLNR